VHLGHLVLADQCRHLAALDEVWFVPASIPPHKESQQISSPRHRLDMLRIAVSGTPWFSISEIELDREGPSYTVESLERLRELHPHHEISLLVGADMLQDFPNWRHPERIAKLCRLIAVNRGRDLTEVQNTAEHLRHSLNADVLVLSIPAIDISATDIRKRVAEGRSIRFLTPRGVEMYIAAQGLYRTEAIDQSSPNGQ
jgi:nicotinate-nucleotide adenylyltransferase